MTLGEQLRWWGVVFAAFIVALWFLTDAVLPFVLGAALAYLTDPAADRLERMGCSRLVATVLITLISLGVVVLAVLLIVPLLAGQIHAAVAAAPGYAEALKNIAVTWLPSLTDEESAVRAALESLRERATGWSVSALARLWSGGLALVDFVSLVVITPVVAFYLLYDWDHMIARIDDCLPRQHRATIRRLARELDRVLAGFVRGQLTVCVILGTFYGLALTMIGLKFGLLIGGVAGLISFIPFLGSILGGVMSIGVAVAQFWDQPALIAGVAVIFAVGQAVEGNFLTPKLVGGSVGLHPVWLMFALSAFGTLFGFVGLLVAVPAAAGIGVLARFLLEEYKVSRLYRGSAEWEREAAARPEPTETDGPSEGSSDEAAP